VQLETAMKVPLPHVIEVELANYGSALHDLGRFASDRSRRQANRRGDAARAKMVALVGYLIRACELLETAFETPEGVDVKDLTAEQAYAVGAAKGALLVVREKINP
jgi:hypothetical protein